MDESLTESVLKEKKALSPEEAFALNSVTLAYIGDAVFELLARTFMLEKGNRRVEKLHKGVTGLVNAGRQSELSRVLLPLLSPEEEKVFRRARNAKAVSSAKNQSITDYRRATGLEAVFGYLYLTGNTERLRFLFEKGTEGRNEENPAQ